MTKELYFNETSTTTFAEIQRIANKLLNSTFNVKVYRSEEGKDVNLADKGWTFVFDNGRNRFGCCKPRPKTISVSRIIAGLNLDKALKIEDTIRHELAHALQYEVYGYSAHDSEWKIIARSVGSNGERCFSPEKEGLDMGTYKYTVFCPTEGCDTENGYHKRPKRVASGRAACGSCCRKLNGGKFSNKYILQYKQNH